jgi:glycosyltransferase involved in cell wall biosynthesis
MSTSDTPLVSVIVCTYNRPEHLRSALNSVFRQDLQDYEVLVVDDGGDVPIEIPAEQRDRVRLIRTGHGGVGAARAAGLNAARGGFIAYCDDDDQWKPQHLSSLWHYLTNNPEVDLVYGDSEWVLNGGAPTVGYSFNYDRCRLQEDNYIFATDVMHRAATARAVGGFDASLEAYEDWDLWLRMSRVHVLRHLPAVLAYHHWHEDCVAAAKRWDEWDRVYTLSQYGAPRASTAAIHDLIPATAQEVPFDRGTWRPGRRELIWQSVLRTGEGYGTVGRQLLLALERQGVDITVAPTRNQAPPGFERLYKPLDHWGRLAFYCNHRLRPSVLPCARIICHSMWESTLVPQEHVEELNRAVTLQYVPCRQNAESFRNCGVRVPIKVLPYGVDVDQFPYLSRSNRHAFTFGSFGDLTPRKGIDVLIRAFEDEFAPGEAVQLLLKTTGSDSGYDLKDPRISLVTGYMDQQQLLEFLGRMDAFVLPSRGEGFGLCGLEAMATGLPLIATNWSGPADYLDPNDSFPLDYRLVDVQNTKSCFVRFFGQWAEPDYEHLRHLLRWLYEHPRETAEKGGLAADRVRRNWTWDRAAKQVCQDLDEVAADEEFVRRGFAYNSSRSGSSAPTFRDGER